MLQDFGVKDVKIQEVLGLDPELIDLLPFVFSFALSGYHLTSIGSQSMVSSSFSATGILEKTSRKRAAQNMSGSLTR